MAITNDLTIDTLTFALAYSGQTGSERRETSRGVNLPEIMSIRHVPYVDAKLKKAGVQSSIRFERYLLSSDGVTIAPVSATLTVRALTDTGVTSADVLAVVQRVATTIQEDDSGLDLPDEIFVSRLQ